MPRLVRGAALAGAAVLLLPLTAGAEAPGWNLPDPAGDVAGVDFDPEPPPCGTKTELDRSAQANEDLTAFRVRHPGSSGRPTAAVSDSFKPRRAPVGSVAVVHASATFTVSDWTPAEPPAQVGDVPLVTTGASAGLAHMVKTFEGDLVGRSITWFLGCLNETTRAGSYAALEAVDAQLHGRTGRFNIVHAASTHGTDRYDEHLVIVPDSGAEELAGIRGRGMIVVDEDGTHHLELDYTLED